VLNKEHEKYKNPPVLIDKREIPQIKILLMIVTFKLKNGKRAKHTAALSH
jgi:hypothetical protein